MATPKALTALDSRLVNSVLNKPILAFPIEFPREPYASAQASVSMLNVVDQRRYIGCKSNFLIQYFIISVTS
jgi:hypothetical protein